MLTFFRRAFIPVVTRSVAYQTHENVLKSPTLFGSLRSSFVPCPRHCQYSNKQNGEDQDLDDDMCQDSEYEHFSNRMFRHAYQPHNVLLVQPYYLNPERRNPNTTPELQLEESVALINSLPGWKVLDMQMEPLMNFKRRDVFGHRTLRILKEKINKNDKISAVFVSLNIFRVWQLIELEDYFEVPCFDRYSIVIQIFRNHAVSREAKLQIQMAEIPYLRQCVKGLPKGFSDRLGSADTVGGTSFTPEETRRNMLALREKRLKAALSKLKNQREHLRLSRGSSPIIAVVGYTNAGKTSLIKALTGEEKMQPRNQLFATLDVTKHAGLLPCQLEVLYVDTVGFINDIPSSLIESFTATLEDAIFSDLIIHVWDVSNPDSKQQRKHVWDTLRQLNLSEELLGKVLEVGNKVDRLSEDDLLNMMEAEPNMLFVSAKTRLGLKDLLNSVEQAILKATKRFRIVMRVKTGEAEYDWLRKQVAVEKFDVDSNNPQYCLLSVLMTDAQLEIFKHKFV